MSEPDTLHRAPTIRAPTIRAPRRPERAAWLHARFAPPESLLDADTTEEGDEPGWHPIAFWWPVSDGVQLVVMPCRSIVQ
jgi:hypothetical protein